MKTLAIIGARLNSSRLPGKHLLPLAGTPMITRIWERLSKCALIEKSVLATTADVYNQPLIQWAKISGEAVYAFSGDVNDLMGRIDSVVQQYQPEFIVYICGDCPLIDPKFIDHALALLQQHPTKDTIALHDDIVSIHEGMAFYTRAGWNKLSSISLSAMDKEHVGYADKNAAVLKKLLITDSEDFSCVKHRISVDTDADYQFMEQVYQLWYDNNAHTSIVDLHWVQQQILRNPNLCQINNHVQQKKPDQHYEKIVVFSHVNARVGIGQLRRSAIIASALQEHLSLGTQLVVHGSSDDYPWLKTATNWVASESVLLAQLAACHHQLVIIDFNPDHIDISRLKVACTRARNNLCVILAIDRLALILDNVDSLFIPSFYSRVQHPKINFGWQNYLFPNIKKVAKKQQILVLTGGSDALGYGKELPTILSQSQDPQWPIIWVQGPLAAAPCLPDSSNIDVIKNPSNLSDLVSGSEIVLSCYGLSLFEAMAAEAATVLLPVAHLCDADELAELERHNCCLISRTLNDAANLMTSLMASPKTRQRLTDKAKLLLDDKVGKRQLAILVKSLLTQVQRTED